MGAPVKFDWHPNRFMFGCIWFTTILLWKETWDLCYQYRDSLGIYAFLIVAVSPFLYLTAIWNTLEFIFKQVYGKGADDIRFFE